MGRNFRVACHWCRTKAFLFRGGESAGLHAFYSKHEPCMRVNPNQVECLDDQMQEEAWMRDDSYQDDTEVEEATRRKTMPVERLSAGSSERTE